MENSVDERCTKPPPKKCSKSCWWYTWCIFLHSVYWQTIESVSKKIKDCSWYVVKYKCTGIHVIILIHSSSCVLIFMLPAPQQKGCAGLLEALATVHETWMSVCHNCFFWHCSRLISHYISFITALLSDMIRNGIVDLAVHPHCQIKCTIDEVIFVPCTHIGCLNTATLCFWFPMRRTL